MSGVRLVNGDPLLFVRVVLCEIIDLAVKFVRSFDVGKKALDASTQVKVRGPFVPCADELAS